MLGEMVAIVPVSLVLGLLAFGRYGGRTTEPNRRTVVLVAFGAVIAGPVAIELLTFTGWLLASGTATAAVTVYAALRGGPRRPAAPHG
jgi:hypothetical protein